MLSPEKSVRGQATEVLHLLVDGSQQLLEDSFQFVFGSVDNLVAKISDSIIEAARRHWQVSVRDELARQNYGPNPGFVRYRTYCRSYKKLESKLR
jgi:hypothetical protein